MLGAKLAMNKDILSGPASYPFSPPRTEEICYYLEKQPFTDQTQNYPTSGCSREDLHLGCVYVLKTHS